MISRAKKCHSKTSGSKSSNFNFKLMKNSCNLKRPKTYRTKWSFNTKNTFKNFINLSNLTNSPIKSTNNSIQWCKRTTTWSFWLNRWNNKKTSWTQSIASWSNNIMRLLKVQEKSMKASGFKSRFWKIKTHSSKNKSLSRNWSLSTLKDSWTRTTKLKLSKISLEPSSNRTFKQKSNLSRLKFSNSKPNFFKSSTSKQNNKITCRVPI